MAAEVSLQDPAVLCPVEQRTPFLELEYPIGRLLGMKLGHTPVVEHLAAAHRVPEVDLPVVLRPYVSEGGRYAALGHDGVCLAEERLADERRPAALVGRLDSRPHARAAGADDDDVVVVYLVVARCDLGGHQKNLGSWMVPIATR
jgi:hypothetical protein